MSRRTRLPVSLYTASTHLRPHYCLDYGRPHSRTIPMTFLTYPTHDARFHPPPPPPLSDTPPVRALKPPVLAPHPPPSPIPHAHARWTLVSFCQPDPRLHPLRPVSAPALRVVVSPLAHPPPPRTPVPTHSPPSSPHAPPSPRERSHARFMLQRPCRPPDRCRRGHR